MHFAPLLLKGAWCSGTTSASHMESPGFKSQCVHVALRAWPPPPARIFAPTKLRMVALVAMRKNDLGRTRTCNLWPRRPTPYPLGLRVSHQLVALTRITAKTIGSRKSDSGSIRSCNRCFVSQPAKVCEKQCLIHLATGPSAVRNGNQRPSRRKDQLYNGEMRAERFEFPVLT